MSDHDSSEAPAASTDIAIIGMACRLPGANDPEEFWKQIRAGRELLTILDDDELRAAGIPDALLKNPQFIRVSGLIDEVGQFDADFFHIPPSEARLMDPQHRLFLELCWLALEDAGINPDTYPNDIGVFASAGRHAYLRHIECNFMEENYLDGSIHGLQSDIGNYGDFLATRVSYRLGLRGPSISVQTACSTSLVAVHLACQSLLLGESDVALAGGVNLHTPQFHGYWYEEGSICSSDGRLRPFDATSNGSVFGNGGGVVALKRLSDALTDRDRIVAVLKGSAINNDGAEKMSFTAPSVRGQAEVVRRAHRIAGIDPRTIGYVETHGTGTVLGDPIEMAALISAFGASAGASSQCALGAAKSQIGHLGPAAGIAGLIKAALVVEHGRIPPCVNFESPNPAINFENSAFFIPTRELPWNGLRRAGVSAFGVGGTNVHAILEQAPNPDRVADSPVRVLPLVVSAASARALQNVRLSLANHLAQTPDLRLGDVAHVLAIGRRVMKHRVAITARTREEAAMRLADSARFPSVSDTRTGLPLVFAFPGMGVQYVRAGRALYESDDEFRAAVDTCCELATAHSVDMFPVLFPDDSGIDEAVANLRLPTWGQLGIFIVEYALAKCLLKAGLQPEMMIGHSVGEYAVACLAGIFTLEEAIRLVAARGRLMSATKPGAMMAVGMSASEVERILPADLDIAAMNAPEQTVVAGPISAIAAFEDHFAGTNILHTVLGTSVAAHSSLMDAIMSEFREVVQSVQPRPTRHCIASTLLGSIDQASLMSEREYWIRHLREPVRFLDGARAILERGPVLLLEVGPGRALAGMTRQAQGDLGMAAITPWLAKEPEPQSSSEIVATVWSMGGRVDWSRQFADQSPRRVALPGYCFDRAAFWTDRPTDQAAAAAIPLPAYERSTLFLQTPSWQVSPLPVHDDSFIRRRVLALVPASHAGFTQKFERGGHSFVELVTDGEIEASNAPGLLARLEDKYGSFDTVLLLAHGSAAAGLEERVADVLQNAFWPALALISAAARRYASSPLDFFLVTFDRYSLEQDSSERPELAVLTGLPRVIPQEYPNVRVAEIDFSPASDDASIAELVCEELAYVPSGSIAALRHGLRYALEYKPARQTIGLPPWIASGNYLITGGLGAIGLALAVDAATVPGLTLTLTHRTPLPDSAQIPKLLAANSLSLDLRHRLSSLERIRAAGAKVNCVLADVSDRQAMSEVYSKFGPFTGIVHAAGVPSGHLIDNLTPAKANRVMDPKIQGVIVLDQVVADSHTQWMALCSSLSGVVGGVGHVDYCSANAFLDAFASWRNRSGRRTVSLAYDAWESVGMAAKEAGKSLAARAMEGVNPKARLRPLEDPLFSAEWIAQNWAEYHGWLRQDVDWMVDEHRIGGVSLLPGTGIIEYLRSAAERRLGSEQFRLTEVDLLRPVVIPAGDATQIAIVIEHRDDELSAKFISRPPGAANWSEHAVAHVKPGVPVITRVESIAPIETNLSGSPANAAFRSSAITFGPRWNNVTGMTRPSEEELILECELSSTFQIDLERYGVHAALLDTAAGGFVPLIDDGVYLPMSYESISILRPMPGKIRSRISQCARDHSDSLRFDVQVKDADGGDILEILGYTLRKVNPDELAGSLNGFDHHQPEPANVSLVSSDLGDISALRFVPEERCAPAASEVEIRVLATGLNFKEVLIASNLIPDVEPDFRFGLECAGVVDRVGEAVTHLRPGDPVMAIGRSCFSSFVCMHESLVQPIPPGLSFAQAASIPIAFATAYDSLANCARLQRGERVLVHSITGGVGMAAVQIATQLGAQVFGTAGNEQKRDLARRLGVDLVMDSRSSTFEQQTIEAGGVDVVLNSLSGDLISAGLRTLRPRGRFIELGRRDILSGAHLDMSLFAQGRTFTSYYPEPDSPAFTGAFQRVAEMLGRKEIAPLPLHSFPIGDAPAAFAFMSRARHVGKVVVLRPGGEQVASKRSSEAASAPGITSPHGVRAMRTALALDASHVLIGRRPVAARGDSPDLFVAEHALEIAAGAPLHSRTDLNYDFVPLEGETENQLGEIWAATLNIERVGRNDQFLDLGGDSLYATQVAARVRKKFSVRIAPSVILGNVRLSDLAALLERQMAERVAP